MIQTNYNKRGAYLGSITSNFPTKQWLLHHWLRLCRVCIVSTVVGVAIMILSHRDSLDNTIFWWCLFFLGGCFILCFVVSFHSFVRIDFYQEEIWLFSKSLLFNSFDIIKMPRKNVRSNLKSSSLLFLKDVFDPVGRSKEFELSQKDGWAMESLSRINMLVRNGYLESTDSSFEHLNGPYIGTIEPECSKNKVLAFLYSSLPGFTVTLLICSILWLATLWELALLIACNNWLLHGLFFIKVKRVEVYDGELMFLGKQSFVGTDEGYVVSPHKIKVTDTYDFFHIRLLKVKEEGSFFPIRLSKRHGWSDAQLDEVKEVIAKAQDKSAETC